MDFSFLDNLDKPVERPIHPAALELDATLDRLRRLGYLNCSTQYDELKDGCAAVRPNFCW